MAKNLDGTHFLFGQFGLVTPVKFFALWCDRVNLKKDSQITLDAFCASVIFCDAAFK